MYYTGFADEAGNGIDAQIKATKELGWTNIESRNIDGTNIHDLDEAKFDEVAGKLEDAGISINCFGSAIANWGRDPRKEEDYQASVEMLERAIPRMQRLGTKLLRGMSFAVVKDEEPDNPELEKIIFQKVRNLVKMCEDAGIIYAHENCMNYGGMSHEHSLKLVDNIKSDNFRLLYDTGNPQMTWNRTGEKPYKKQRSWDFYSAIKEHICYVHIKDGVYNKETDGIFPDSTFTFPGEGDGDVEKIVADLLKNGYDGGFSMEPHMALVFHEGDSGSEEEVKYQNYVEYGRRFMKLVEKVS